MIGKSKSLYIPHFENPEGIRIITRLPGEKEVFIPGIEPLIDENLNFTGIIGLYSKDGELGKETKKFYRKYRGCFKWVYLSSNGTYFKKHYHQLYRQFDAVSSMDCDLFSKEYYSNNLEISFSMMARSGPLLNGFFFEYAGIKEMDYSILTWYGDSKAKVWPDTYNIVCELSERGIKGIVVTQRGSVDDLKRTRLGEYEKKGLVELHQADYSEMELTQLVGRAYVGLFPNKLDAFPKHIIETLLSDKPIVISPKLLFGRATLAELGEEVTLVQDFRERETVDRIIRFINNTKGGIAVSPREEWLKRYCLDELSSKWAKEINRVFNTRYKAVSLMRYTNRFVSFGNAEFDSDVKKSET